MSLFSRKPAGPRTLPVDPTGGDPEAARIRTAMRARDWATVRSVLDAAEDPDDHAFLVDHASAVEGSEDWLPDVIRRELDSTLPVLVYGARAIDWAWEARSGARAKYVGEDQWRLFFERLRIAQDCLRAVVRREPDNTSAWHQLITVALGLQLDPSEARHNLDQVLARVPGHVPAHRSYLQFVCGKWYGSHEQMHAFAREAMLKAPAGSPLGHLVAAAHLEQWLDLDRGDDATYIRSKAVRAALHEAADRSVRHPDYRPRRGWLYTHNTFAMAFALAGEKRAAAEQFAIIGDRVTELPWAYYRNDPGEAFCLLRARSR